MQLLPRDLRVPRKDGSTIAIFNVGAYDPSNSTRGLGEYLLHATEQHDTAILLVEGRHVDIVRHVRSACFTAVIDASAAERNFQNYFHGLLSRALKNIGHVTAAMQLAECAQTLSLPLRNFKSPAMEGLNVLCAYDSMTADFKSKLTQATREVLKTRRPRRPTTSGKRYFVDTEAKLFEFAKEIHAELATGEPHTPVCEIQGNFRYGKRIATNRHFNVTRESGSRTRISGYFPNCHDDLVEVKETTHINMFSNDYH